MEHFDYIIIGGGTAGCLLANRLSTDPTHRVLLLEAGRKDQNLNIHIPAAFSKLFKSKTDWNFETLPQPDMANRKLFQPRGKVLGGCSSMNAMIYIRGHRYDFDSWAAQGNPGWGYDQVLPYFIQSEQNAIWKNAFHGQDGELSVVNQQDPHPLSQALIKAAEQAGFPVNPDFNGAKQEGFGLYQVNQKEGRRFSSARAFLKPILNRPNLEVLTEATVHKVQIANQMAIGIFYEQQGKKVQARARQEVILSAGAFNSPHLLMLSGIGDPGELQKHGIAVAHALPGVGKNLQDHLIAGITKETNAKHTLDRVESFPEVFKQLWLYLRQKKGRLSSNIAEAGGFVKTHPDEPAPDIQYHFAPGFFINHGLDNPKGKPGYSLGATLIAPKSKGKVRLSSKNPGDKVLVDPEYLSDQRDIRSLISGVHIANRILKQAAFDPYRKGHYYPEKELTDVDEIVDFLKGHAETLYHPVGTCKMGKDKMAVVDSELKVHGIERLRVVDASIMPIIVRGNTNAATVMIAEKGAAMILAKRKKKRLKTDIA